MTTVATMLDPVGRRVATDVDDLSALLAHEHGTSVTSTLTEHNDTLLLIRSVLTTSYPRIALNASNVSII